MTGKENEANPMDEFFHVVHSFRRLNISSMLPDITNAELGTLSMIYHCMSDECDEGVKISEVVNHMHVAPPAVSRIIKSLEEKGYVERTVDRKDRRNTFVRLTDKGSAIRKESRDIMHDFGRAVLGEMGEDSINKLTEYLRNMLTVSEAELEKRKYKNRKDEESDE